MSMSETKLYYNDSLDEDKEGPAGWYVRSAWWAKPVFLGDISQEAAETKVYKLFGHGVYPENIYGV